MGRVYLCDDRDLEVEVAVKVLPHELSLDEKSLAAIEREAKLAARLRGCPGILQLYEFERYEGECLLVMEFAAGGSVAQVLQSRGALPEEDCRRLGAGVAEALGFAHERKILHRDVKPGNVLLSLDGDVRVADFGLSRVLSESSSSRSSTGQLAGTPAYLPPEVLQRKKVDHRGDLYALGCVLYEMATGVPPYSGTFAEVAMAKSRKETRVPDPRESKEDVSAEYAAVARTLMAWDPVERYADGRTVAAILRGTAPASAPARREAMMLDAPVEPAVRGLPPPSHPPLGATALPAGFVEHSGRIWCLRDGAEMAFVPGGEFTMGSDHGSPDEVPAHVIHLGPFLADRHEVTVWQFARFCRETKRAMPEQPTESNDRHPVVNVAWAEARAYAEWAGKNLPTEAQWEKAARGADAREFPWGNEPLTEDRARFRNAAEEGTASVGAYPAGRSPYGCLDMVGNAWEWVADWYAEDYYGRSPPRDPIGPVEGASRVLRGGILGETGADLRVTKRRRSRPESRFDFVGFRCVKELPAK
jgi:serine/threonine-protein kinase